MNAPAPRVAIAGEALIDLLIEDDRRRPTASPGGSPANTAVTLARLGTSTTFLGRFGNDSFGSLLRDNLAANGVRLDHAVDATEPASDVVKVSAEDIDWAYPGTDPLDVAHAWQGDGGPAVVVVTLGGDGAVACRDGRTVRAPAAALPIADTVGAGDAFSGGLLHWLSESDFLRRERLRVLTDEELRMSLEYAATVAGVTCTRPGADPPRAREVATLLPHSFRAR